MNTEPTVEFFKGRVGAASGALLDATVATLAADTTRDISYARVADGLQSGNWVHKTADPAAGSVSGETNLWATLPVAWAAAVDSGVGFIGSSALSMRDVKQGDISEYISILIFNNRTGAALVSAAENCFLRVYDSPTVLTQAKQPISGLVGPNHTFWTRIEQKNYRLKTGWLPDSTQMTTAHLGPYHLGAATTNQWSAPPLAAPNAGVVPFDNVLAKEGLGYFGCGSGNNGSGINNHYLGCGNANDPLTECVGGAVELEMLLFVPSNATASALYWALALEYTFVVE